MVEANGEEKKVTAKSYSVKLQWQNPEGARALAGGAVDPLGMTEVLAPGKNPVFYKVTTYIFMNL